MNKLDFGRFSLSPCSSDNKNGVLKYVKQYFNTKITPPKHQNRPFRAITTNTQIQEIHQKGPQKGPKVVF